jgi:hypothetical protein
MEPVCLSGICSDQFSYALVLCFPKHEYKPLGNEGLFNVKMKGNIIRSTLDDPCYFLQDVKK